MKRHLSLFVVYPVMLAMMLTSVSVGCAQSDVSSETIAKIKEALPATAPAKPKHERKVLIFTKTAGFRHDSIPVATVALKMLGEKTGAFSAVHSEDESMFEPEKLKEFDAVFMINTTGEVFRPKEMPADEAGKKKALEREARLQKSLVDFVKSGKGLCGTHSATDTYREWKDYNEMMGGAFVSHPWHEAVPVRILDKEHPLNKVFKGEGFTITDEIYQFRDDTALASDRRMLLTLQPGWDGLSRGERKDKLYPISWIDKYGEGRIFYCSLGHRQEIYYNPVVLEHYLAGFQYALGDLDANAEPVEVKAE
jgi:uncharacterized protein